MKIAIIGSGVMGRGWITQFAMGGHEVHCHDTNSATLDGVLDFCTKLAGKTAKRAKIDDPELPAKVGALIHTHAERGAFVDAAKGCAVLLECVFEDMKLKCELLSDIVPKLPASVYFWSNTSSLDINVMAAAAGRPERSIITHGMNPVPMMSGVEVVPGKDTSAETVEFARKMLLELKKVPFLAPNIPGFWVNRLLVPYLTDAIRFLEQGEISIEDGDNGLTTSLGHPQGVFKLADFISLPTILRIGVEMYQNTDDPRMYPPLMVARMVKDGAFGSQNGKGFYDWSDPKNPKPRDLSAYQIKTADDVLNALK
ncbi:MAG: 3-hydroxyacyl-CoA dehydrogenase family protein [Pseudomonadota bacterium]